MIRRHLFVFGLSVFFAAVISPCVSAGEKAAEDKLEELVAGTWEGYHATGGGVWRHSIDVRGTKSPGRFQGTATGYAWVILREEQVERVKKRRRPNKKDIYYKSRLWFQQFQVTLDKGNLTFKGIRVKDVLGNGKGYQPDVFSGPMKAPGVLAGEIPNPKEKHETYLLARREALESPPLTLEKGKTHKLTCLDDGTRHLSVYIPKSYSHTKKTPVLINCSPGGNAGPLSTKMAEELGWIMAGLGESKNGPLQPCVESIAATMFDLRRRLNIDTKKLYFSGFSGGARVAAWAALLLPDAQGVICIGAGYLGDNRRFLPPHQAVCFIAGETDSGREETTMMYNAGKAAQKMKLIIHPGGHTWGRAEDHEAAVRWLASPE